MFALELRGYPPSHTQTQYIPVHVMRTIHHLLLGAVLLFACGFCHEANAQNDKGWRRLTIRKGKSEEGAARSVAEGLYRLSIDSAVYRLYYEIAYRPQPSNPELEVVWTQVLQIGLECRKYVNYGTLQADSIYDISYHEGTPFSNVAAQCKEYEEEGRFFPTSLIIDNKTDNMEILEKIGSKLYTYNEPAPKLKWELLDGFSTIGGYKCRQATTTYRGRKYIAWYTDKFPMKYGPYKFGGLPGLIVCIYDEAKDYTFTLTGFERAPKGEHIFRPSQSESVEGTPEERKKAWDEYVATSKREAAQRQSHIGYLKRMYPRRHISEQPIIPVSYNPLEKD